MTFRLVGLVSMFVVGVVAGAMVALSVTQIAAREAPRWEEWTLPARFEGEGALTLGCAFWDVPMLTGYGDENPRTDQVVLAVTGQRGDVETLFSIDGPHGTAFVGGQKCAVSVDWSAFPVRQRPAD